MIKLNFLFYSVCMIVIINACSTILEPVSIIIPDKASDDIIVQEEFNIIIKSLNFKNSNKANKDAYPRQLMLTGSGAKAKLLNEKNFLTSKMPEFESIQDYRIGFKDELSFTLLNEFKNDELQWPDVSDHSEYLLGVGDKLKLIHFADVESISVLLGRDTGGNIDDFDPNDNLIESAGIIGSNGKILLLGLGNIMAANRTLSDVQAEVRNILLRNGLAHSFQLEIDAFQSKKAYVTHTNNKSSVIPINNISISLKEIALMEGLSESYKNNALITLARDYKEFRITAGQLFSPNAPEIYIQDKDQIEIKTFSESYTRTNVVVGSKGNILLPEVGVINIVDKKLDEVQELVSIKLIEKGLMPKFQLELIKFISQKAYLIKKNEGSIVVPLTNEDTSLRELILSANFISSKNELPVVTLKRNGETFRMTVEKILDLKTPNIWIQSEDQIEIENLAYKPGQVFALSGSTGSKIIPIDPSKRETLADVLFAPGGAITNRFAKRSEVYLLRGRNPSFAYHLDAQNVSRILVAAKTELRPNDIIYVAERPIISFARTLEEITPLRNLLRDIQNDNIP